MFALTFACPDNRLAAACSSEPKEDQRQGSAANLAGQETALPPPADAKPAFHGLRIHFKRPAVERLRLVQIAD